MKRNAVQNAAAVRAGHCRPRGKSGVGGAGGGINISGVTASNLSEGL
jgi:hypothetical protein